MRTRFRRRRPRALALVVLAGSLLTATTATTVAPVPPAGATIRQVPPALRSIHWYIDANTLSVVNAEDDDCYVPNPFGGCLVRSDGDEPQIAVVAFRTRLGVPGSTQAWKLNTLHELCSGADAGARCAIPDITGRAHFGFVQRPTAAQLAAGTAPELVGTIQVTFDNDGTPDSIMNGIIDRLVNGTRQELAAASEGLTPAQIRDPAGVATRFVDIGDRIESHTQLSWWQNLGIWIGSGGDIDDKVDYRVTLMVGVGRDLADPINLVLLANFYTMSNGVPVPNGKIVPAVIGTRDITLTHATSGVRYDVAERVFSQLE